MGGGGGCKASEAKEGIAKCTYTHICMCIHMYACALMYMLINTHAYMHTHVGMHAHAYACIHENHLNQNKRFLREKKNKPNIYM